MQTIDPGHTGAAAARSAKGRWGAPIEASIAVLELTASEQPDLLEFQAHVLCNSTMSFAVQKLATVFDVAPERLGRAIGRACQDLDRLEKHRGGWRDPAQVAGRPNLAALRHVCHARLHRVEQVNRRRRLERILRRVEASYQLAKSRAWIESFIGPLPGKGKEAEGAGIMVAKKPDSDF